MKVDALFSIAHRRRLAEAARVNLRTFDYVKLWIKMLTMVVIVCRLRAMVLL